MAKGKRAPSPPRTDAVNCHSRRGRRVQLSEDALLRALESGKDVDTIASANRCSPRTVARRIAAARALHGPGWGRPSDPEPPPAPKLPPIPTSGVPDWAGLVDAGRGVVWQGINGELSPDPKDRLRACEVAFRHADTLRSEDRGHEEVDHADLLARIEAATAPPEPNVSEGDLAPEGTGAPGA
ncbi:MAG: hypothetical protein ACRBN8_46345 [Nannocystales bacterium]